MKTLSELNIEASSRIFMFNIHPCICRITLQLCHHWKGPPLRSLPVPLQSNHPPKTRVPDGFQFEPAFQLQQALRSSELIRKYGMDGMPELLDIIDSYCNEQAVRFGDTVSIIWNRPKQKDKISVELDGMSEFRIMKGYGDRSYDGQPVRYGQDFVLQISQDHYLQRTEYIPDKRKSVKFRIGSQHMVPSPDVDSEYGQTLQIDVVDRLMIGKIIRYGPATEAIGLTVGGNYARKAESSMEWEKNPNNNFREWFDHKKDGWFTKEFSQMFVHKQRKSS